MKIAAFYSQGPHFPRMLEALRAAYPGAVLTAIVPQGYPAHAEIEGMADAIQETGAADYSPRRAEAWRLLAALRRERYDVLAVMFDSLQLQLLAALSRPRRSIQGTMDGRLVDLPRSAVVVLANEAVRRTWGHGVYAAVWLAVHLLSVSGAEED